MTLVDPDHILLARMLIEKEAIDAFRSQQDHYKSWINLPDVTEREINTVRLGKDYYREIAEKNLKFALVSLPTA